MARTNSFEGGTDETTITTGNSGGGSGDAFATPVVGTGATVVFDNAQAAHGSYSARIGTTGTSSLAYLPYTLASVAADYLRMYLRLVSLPSAATQPILRYMSGAGQALRVNMKSGGAIEVRNAANTVVGTTTATITPGSWFRVEMHTVFSATVGTCELRLYLSPDSSTATETLNLTSLVLTASSSEVRFGVGSALANAVDTWFDELGIEGATWFGPSVVAGDAIHAWVGAPTDEGFRVRALTDSCTSVELVVSSDDDMDPEVATFGPVAPDAQNYADFTATGLDPGTTYWFQLQDVGTPIGDIGRAKTLPTVGDPATFRVAFGGCTLNNNAHDEAFDDIRAWDPAMLIHLGDFHYRDPDTATVATHRGHLETQILGAAGLAQVLREVPTVYARSDHDAGPGDNGDSNTANGQAAIDAYKQVVPHFPLADPAGTTTGLWTSWVIGRVRFILLDIRNTQRTAGLTTQGPSKTMLGSAQLAWLLSELDEDEPLKVICCDVAWMGDNPSPITEAQDKWPSYADERATIADHITDNGIKVVYIHSDTHSLARATGAANAVGGFPIFCAAAFGNIGGGRYLSTFSQYYNTGASQGSQYGRLTFTDTGDQITVEFDGWDALVGTSRMTQTEVFTTAEPDDAGALPIAFGSASSATYTSSTASIVVTRPAGLAEGEVMLAVIGHLKTSTPETTITSVPAGWTLLGEQTDGTGVRAAVYHRTAGASEPATYTWTLSVAFKAFGWIGRYTGVDPDDPIRASSSAEGSSGTSHDTPDVAAVDGDWLVTAVATRHTAAGGGATTWTSDAGTDAERLEFGSNGGSGQDITGAVYDSGGALAAGTYDRTLTSSLTESLVAVWSVVLRSQVAAYPPLEGSWGIPAHVV